MRPCYASIDLRTLKSNLESIKSYSKKDIIGVVKANAYGHGDIEISRVLVNNGVNMLAVATVEEALNLRKNFQCEILILGHASREQIEDCVKNNIILSVSSLEQAMQIDYIAQKINSKAKIHFAIDTGMGRVGYFLHAFNNSVITEIKKIELLKNIILDGVFTHFASADESSLDFMQKQYSIFRKVILSINKININPKYVHCQNSAGIINLNDDICTAVRPGIILYGYYPSKDVPKVLDIKPILSWNAHISHIKKVPKNTPVGYGSTYLTKKESIIATVPAGYADGVNRMLSGKYDFMINGSYVKLIGRVCMDQVMIDVSEIDGCKIGDKIELINETISADTMASSMKSIPYEILCSISSRVPRVYEK